MVIANLRTRVAVKTAGGFYTLYRKTQDGSFEEYATGIAEDALEETGAVIVDSLTELMEALPSPSEFGEMIGAATAAAIQATSSFSGTFIREVGPALVDSAEGFYNAVARKISGQEANAIAGITVGVLTLVTVLFLFHEVSRGPTP
tara:strand:- start:246 stop:683 length:438 start_codon:yes stop_codon:yes gene_type:complete